MAIIPKLSQDAILRVFFEYILLDSATIENHHNSAKIEKHYRYYYMASTKFPKRLANARTSAESGKRLPLKNNFLHGTSDLIECPTYFNFTIKVIHYYVIR